MRQSGTLILNSKMNYIFVQGELCFVNSFVLVFYNTTKIHKTVVTVGLHNFKTSTDYRPLFKYFKNYSETLGIKRLCSSSYISENVLSQKQIED